VLSILRNTSSGFGVSEGSFDFTGVGVAGIMDSLSICTASMPTHQEFMDAVDAFFQADKTLVVGEDMPQWQDGRDSSTEKCMKIPIAIEDVQYGQRLELVSCPNNEVLRFSISIIFPPAVCRLDFDETDGHTNSLVDLSDGLPLLVQGTHFHRWSFNKRFFKSHGRLTQLRNAEPVQGLRSFSKALRWFCGETKIQLPYNWSVELPDRDKLL
jgi:hypothetical protein